MALTRHPASKQTPKPGQSQSCYMFSELTAYGPDYLGPIAEAVMISRLGLPAMAEIILNIVA